MGAEAWMIGWVVGVILAWFGLAKREHAVPAPLRAAIRVAEGVSDLDADARRERESLEAHRAAAPFRQSRTVSVDPERGRILGFCTLSDGRLAVVCGRGDAYGAVTGTVDPVAVPNRLAWMAADGAEERSVDLDFAPRGVNQGPDGSVWVVGDAAVARYAADGTRLLRAEAPHFSLPSDAKEEFAEEARVRHAAEIESYDASVRQQREMVAELEAKKEGEPGYQTPEIVDLYRRSAESLETHVESRRKMTDDQVVDEAIERAKQIHRVAVAEDAVYLVTNQESGYGFAVWRLSPDLEAPERILHDLAGCCGQMDVQAVEGGLAIAENSRHHVRIVDQDGEPIRTFGAVSRADIATGFGGCCNPMNTCRDGQGGLLTSESNGVVKRYSLDGTFHEVVGVAEVVAGCKNSSIGLSADGATLYYLDIQNGTIVVLERAG